MTYIGFVADHIACGAFLILAIGFPVLAVAELPDVPGHCVMFCDPPTFPQPPQEPQQLPRQRMSLPEISFLPRCDSLTISDLPRLSDLLNRLRKDPFVDAFTVYIEKLEVAEQEFRGLSTGLASLATQCSQLNADSRRFDNDARSWKESACVKGVREDDVGECRERYSRLASRRRALHARYKDISNETSTSALEFQGVSSREQTAIRNAIALIDHANTEQALRLYIWHIFKQDGQPPRNSCHAFSRIASALGNRITDPLQFINMLARNLINPRLDINIIAGTPPARPFAGNYFTASGFNANYIDAPGDNQVRHAVGFMLLGYRIDVGVPAATLVSMVTDVLTKQRGKVQAGDFHLAIASAQLGVRLQGGIHTTRTFGDAMKRALCAPSGS